MPTLGLKLPIHVSTGRHPLRIEYAKPDWLIWQHANKDFTAGTYTVLCPDGTHYCEVLHEDGSVERYEPN